MEINTVAKKLVMKNQKASMKVSTPVGRFLWLNLAHPKPADAPMQANKYTCTVAWDKKEMTDANKSAMQALVKAIEDVAREAYGDDTLTIKDIPQSVLKDGASMENLPYLHDMWVCSSSTGAKYPPIVYGPVKAVGAMPVAEIENIAQGDYGRMVITVSAYKTPATHGITCYLSLAQFAKKGEYLGGSTGSSLIDDLDVGLDNVEESETETASGKKEDNLDDFFSL